MTKLVFLAALGVAIAACSGCTASRHSANFAPYSCVTAQCQLGQALAADTNSAGDD